MATVTEFDPDEYELHTALGVYVKQRYDAAVSAKQEIQGQLIDCIRLIRGDKLGCSDDDDDIDIQMNIVAPTIHGIVGLLRDVFGGSADEPYVIRPTPIPDLTPRMRAELRDKLVLELPRVVAQAGGDRTLVKQQLASMKRASQIEEARQAARAAEMMSGIVRDRLVDADWLNAFNEFINNFSTFPTAIMKTPSVVVKRWKQWDGDRISVVSKPVRIVENISPLDFYLSPGASDIQSAEYVIERRRASYNELLGLAGQAGYWAEGIADVLESMPKGYIDSNADEHHPAGGDIEDSTITDVYDMVGYYGKIRGEHLKEHGVFVADDEANYEAEIWVVDNIVVKAVLNPDILGRRPFFSASFEPIPGQFWGMCPTLRLKDIQRVCTACAKNLVRNMGFASGPIGEVDIERVEDDGDPREYSPWQMKLVNSGGSQNPGPAYRWHDVNSHASELLAVFDKFLAYSYEVIGIPRVAFGNSSGLGETGRTQGGIAMIMNQASKTLKYALRVLEARVIEPCIQEFIDYELMTNPDPSILGDVKVYASAVSGLVEKQAHMDNMTWALQSIAPMMQVQGQDGQPLIPPTAPLRILYELFKAKGIPTQGILPDFEMQDIIDRTAPRPPSFSAPALDNRSAAAQNAIQNMNGGMQ